MIKLSQKIGIYDKKKRKFVTKPRVKMGTCEKIQIWIYVSLET